MPNCVNCNKRQKHLNNGSLCKSCFTDQSFNANNDSSGFNTNTNTDPDELTFNQDGSTWNSNNASASSTDILNPSILTRPDLNKPVSQLCVQELISLLQPLEKKIDNLEHSVNKRMKSIETRNDVLEKELHKQKKKSDVLTGIIVDMQRALNNMDSGERSKNIIVSGLTEKDITIPNEPVLKTDQEKIQFILRKINVNDVDVNNCQFHRIGKEVDDRSRMLKINLNDKVKREVIMAKAPELRKLDEPLKKIFINRDSHPVYHKENTRLRKEMRLRKQKPGYEHETNRVKLEKGELKVDGITVDRNTFFH